MVVYTPRGGTEKSALKGCLPPACERVTMMKGLSSPNE